MIAAGQQMGLEWVSDLNDKPVARVGYYSHNIRKGRRVSAAHAFLDPVKQQPNLTILTRATVQRVLMRGKRATGISVLVKGAVQDFEARREVVICGGLLESPRLLQLSGIGPADVLAAAGVELVHESPDVGRRMLEHLSLAVPFRIRSKCGSHRNFFGLGLVKSAIQYQLFRTGALATGPFEVGAFAAIGDHQGAPNLQLYLGGYVFALSDDNHPVPLSQVDREPGLSIYLQILQLTSEGSIRITSADPGKPALIDPNWLATPEDRQLAIDSVRYVRKYAAQSALGRHIVHELLPGESCQSDEDILHAFRKLATSGLHGTGTCRMGGDDEAVVDSELRVKGVEGLRVADCSIMPNLVSGNTNAPAMAVGFRAAEIIQAEHGR
jgi:choline dehydrogenase-like flavoprotein